MTTTETPRQLAERLLDLFDDAKRDFSTCIISKDWRTFEDIICKAIEERDAARAADFDGEALELLAANAAKVMIHSRGVPHQNDMKDMYLLGYKKAMELMGARVK